MAVKFPASPAINDIYTDPTGNRWKWNGSGWDNLGKLLELSTSAEFNGNGTTTPLSIASIASSKISHGTGTVEEALFCKLVDLTLPANTDLVNITQDSKGNTLNIKDGDSLILFLYVAEWHNLTSSSNAIRVSFNGRSDNVFYLSTTDGLGYLFTAGASAVWQATDIHINLINGQLSGSISTKRPTTQNTYSFTTIGFNDVITSIQIYPSSPTTSLIKAGTIIKLNKIC
jgi:hypothetical protein